MADDFRAFMAENAVRYNEARYVVSQRFKDEKGEPIAWRFRILSEDENSKLLAQCRRRVTDIKTRQTTVETDSDKYNDLLIQSCVIYPNLNDEALQESYGAVGAAELARKMLLPGEYADLLLALTEASGFDGGMAGKIKLVKN